METSIGHLKQTFVEESNELLECMEQSLMHLEADPGSRDDIDAVFRSLHTIKGGSGMFGYEKLARYVHDLEERCSEVREGRRKAGADFVAELLNCGDTIKEMLATEDGEGTGGPDQKAAVGLDHKGAEVTEASPRSLVESPMPRCYSIRFAPGRGIFRRGLSVLPIIEELRSLGELRIVADEDSIPAFDKFEPELCYSAWNMELETTHSEREIRDVFIFVQDDGIVSIKATDPTGPAVQNHGADRKAPAPEGSVSPAKTAGSPRPATPGPVSTSVRVPSHKLDNLVDLVGELVTLQSRMSDEAHRHQIAEFLSIAENLSRLSADLREGSLSIRMIPLSEIFVGFNRPVHDLARELGKEIRLVMRGGETELDKNIVDRLKEPLIHLIRNAADHGLETAEERLASGKPREGLIRLEAEQAGSTVLLRIVDDGKGLDRARILEKAIEKGILSAREDISDIEVFSAIFEPGFSTARHTTAISGRGVGMDVVRRTVEELGGRVELASRLGVGTTVTLSIPLTLAIIDGFMVESSGERFVVNLSQVRECLAYTASEELGASFRLVSIQGELIPCADLTRLLGLTRKATVSHPVSHAASHSQTASQLLICQLGLDRYGFLVDRIIGQHQTVIKPLSKRENRFGVLSGATILGNGSVALILDVARLVQHSQSLVRTRALHSGTRAIAKTPVPALQ